MSFIQSFFQQQWYSFWYAMAFLTRFPTVNLAKALEQNKTLISQRSVYFYPLVGVLIGGLVFIVYYFFIGQNLLNDMPVDEMVLHKSYVVAALMLTMWCLITGGLHLDGLADAADAWVGGFGDRQRTLDIMKDPSIGPAGLMLVILVLLLKYSALIVLINQDSAFFVLAALLCIPMLARLNILPLFYFTPYVRDNGLGRDFKKSVSFRMLAILITVCFILTVWLLSYREILALWIVLWGVFIWARRLMISRIGGTTGDTAGALIEVQEALLLVIIVL